MKIRFSPAFGFCVAIALLAASCGAPEPPPATPGAPPPAAAPGPEPAAPAGDQLLVIFLGDSLTAGFELEEAEAFPAQVEARLRAAGRAVRVVNAGISGDTTAGGLARLDWLLRQRPDVLFVGLGGNDGLRGTPLDASEANLRAILERARAAGARVLLAGMLIPPNYGADYTQAFAAIYPRLAAEFDVPLIPFLLEGVAARPELNLEDGIHPNAEGQRMVAETVLEHLEPLLDELAGGDPLESESE